MDELAEVLAHQSGLLLRSQALELGVTDSAIRWRIARGSWQRILPGLLATFAGRLSHAQSLTAAALYGGAGAQITGCAALRWHGARYLPRDSHIDVLVPANRQRRSRKFARIHRTTRPDQHALPRKAIEVCSVARAAADAARLGYPPREVRALLADVVQRGLTTVDRLALELAAGPRNGSQVLREAMGELFGGVRSAPEGDLRRVLLSSTILPPIVWNPDLIADDSTPLPCPDGWIQHAGIALEADSQEFHTDLAGWDRTRERHGVFGAYGILALHFSPRDIRTRPEWVRTVVEQAYVRRAGTFTGVTVVDVSSHT